MCRGQILGVLLDLFRTGERRIARSFVGHSRQHVRSLIEWVRIPMTGPPGARDIFEVCTADAVLRDRRVERESGALNLVHARVVQNVSAATAAAAAFADRAPSAPAHRERRFSTKWREFV